MGGKGAGWICEQGLASSWDCSLASGTKVAKSWMTNGAKEKGGVERQQIQNTRNTSSTQSKLV
jgi:hypothetical protein